MARPLEETGGGIRAVPMVYNGIRFRSTLEADWAATFDALAWYWEYEPYAVEFTNGQRYLPDFRLPGQHAWCEVKGPHGERADKPRRLHQGVGNVDSSSGDRVIFCRPAGPGRAANWHCATGDHRVTITKCGACQQWCFTKPLVDQWRCRHCGAIALIPEVSYLSASQGKAKREEFAQYSDDWVRDWYGEFGLLKFARAPRPGRVA